MVPVLPAAGRLNPSGRSRRPVRGRQFAAKGGPFERRGPGRWLGVVAQVPFFAIDELAVLLVKKE